MSADTTKNAVVWFEIPATNLARAVAFYEKILGVSLKKETMEPNELAVFPYSEGEGVSGCVISGAGYLPAKEGTVVYLHAESGVDAVLGKVNAAGGMILLGKTALPPGMGFFAHMLDTEGNRVGLHSLK